MTIQVAGHKSPLAMRNVHSRMISALSGPLVVAAGPWSSGECTGEPLSAADAVVAKTVTSAPRSGNPPPVLRTLPPANGQTPAGYLNRIGLRNVGAQAFVRDRLPLVQRCGRPIIQSFTAQTEAEVEEILAQLEPVSFLGYELNASCPNATSGLLSTQALRTVLVRARALTQRPITVKLAYQSADELLAKARICEDCGADALTAINTMPALDLSPIPLASESQFVGGLSGPGLNPFAQWAVAQLVREQSLPVIACGGIHSLRQVLAFCALGAQAVQIGSVLIEDPQRVTTLRAELFAAYKQHQVDSFAALGERLCQPH